MQKYFHVIKSAELCQVLGAFEKFPGFMILQTWTCDRGQDGKYLVKQVGTFAKRSILQRSQNNPTWRTKLKWFTGFKARDTENKYGFNEIIDTWSCQTCNHTEIQRSADLRYQEQYANNRVEQRKILWVTSKSIIP